MITDEESRTLIAQAKVDRVWMDQAVRAYRPFIVRWAIRFARPRRLDYDELIAVGLEVSVRAVRAFDLEGKVPWLKFLRLCVDRKWRDMHPVRKPGSRLPPIQFSQLFNRKGGARGWDMETRIDQATRTLAQLADSDIRRRLARDYTSAQVWEILEKMPRDLADMLRAAYGIGEERKTVTQIAEELGVSRKTQRTRLDKALRNFRGRWEPLAART